MTSPSGAAAATVLISSVHRFAVGHRVVADARVTTSGWTILEEVCGAGQE